MTKALLAAVLLLQAGTSQTQRLAWVPNPRTTYGGWVSDPANHLSADTRAQLNTVIATLERETTTEIAVVVIDTLDGLAPSQAAFNLHRQWGVGKRDRDNGIVVLWSPRQRQTYVSIGQGLEGVLPDHKVGRVQDEYMIPAFRRSDFDGGMLATVSALADIARGEKFVGPRRVRIEAFDPESSTREFFADRDFGWWMGFVAGIVVAGFFAVVILIGLAMAIAQWVKRKLPRRCPKGHGLMQRVPESGDNLHLDEAEALEEKLKSVDYDVWICATCGATTKAKYRNDESSYKACPKCARMTLRAHTRSVKDATYTEKGKGIRTRECKYCKFKEETEVFLPMKIRYGSSSSGGSGWSSGGGGGSSFSGGSSFGGGSSGGGGAGRSY